MDNTELKKSIKITCISDTHTKTKELKLPEGDILIHCGDFTRIGRKKEIVEFNEFMKKQNFKHKIVIAGNHDLVFDSDNYDYFVNTYKDKYKKGELVTYEEAKSLLKDCNYLENSGIRLMNINFWGYPVSSSPVDGAFNYHSECNETKIKDYLDKVPSDIDIFISHGPPQGILDKIYDGRNVGCKVLRDYILYRIKPEFHIFGHIHESNGITKEIIDNKEINFINAAVCDIKYQPTNKIISFEYEIKS